MRSVALAVIAVGIAGCGTPDRQTASAGACAAAVRYHDMLYIATGPLKTTPEPGKPLSGGVSPACQDTVPRSDARDRPIGLQRVKGVSPQLAVYEPRRHAVYINVGSFPELRDHPLHDAVYGSPRRPVSHFHGAPCVVDGAVIDPGHAVAVRTAAGRDWYVHVDVRTRIDGLRSPILRKGDQLHLTGRCRDNEMLARRIAPPA